MPPRWERYGSVTTARSLPRRLRIPVGLQSAGTMRIGTEREGEPVAREERERPHGRVPAQWQRIEHHTRTLDRAIRITQMADAKVAPVLALHVSLAAIAVTQGGELGRLLEGVGYTTVVAISAWLLLFAYVFAALVASFFVIVVYVPTAPRRGAARTHSNSIFYFDDIQAMPVDDFETRSTRMDIDLAERDVIRQAHTVSRIASDKLIGVQRAYLFSAIALFAWMMLILLTKL